MTVKHDSYEIGHGDGSGAGSGDGYGSGSGDGDGYGAARLRHHHVRDPRRLRLRRSCVVGVGMKPKRIQLSRKKGWRKPDGAVVVARPSKWGNPFRVGDPGVPDAATAVECFEGLEGMVDGLEDLRGKDLACWCPLDQACHADVLLKWANR